MRCHLLSCTVEPWQKRTPVSIAQGCVLSQKELQYSRREEEERGGEERRILTFSPFWMKSDLHVSLSRSGSLSFHHPSPDFKEAFLNKIKGWVEFVFSLFVLFCFFPASVVRVSSQPGRCLCYWLSLFRDSVIRSEYLSLRVEPGSEVTAGSAFAILCSSWWLKTRNWQERDSLYVRAIRSKQYSLPSCCEFTSKKHTDTDSRNLCSPWRPNLLLSFIL